MFQAASGDRALPRGAATRRSVVGVNAASIKPFSDPVGTAGDTTESSEVWEIDM